VTGASSGIGTALARQLAAAGVGLVLVARRVDRLDELAAELRPTTDVEVLTADLAAEGDRARVAARLADADHPIDLLINCAGLGSAGPFADGDVEVYRQMLAVNVEALVVLSHAAVGPMRARGRGWIVNISSLGGHAPGPRFAVYSATKAFVTSFSEALHEELRRSGVVVTAICPGATRTEFGKVSGADSGGLPGFLWQDADEVASEALAAAAAGKAVQVTGWPNRLAAGLTAVLPRSANRRIAARVADQL
jgi:short-subunit dehydrogenase